MALFTNFSLLTTNAAASNKGGLTAAKTSWQFCFSQFLVINASLPHLKLKIMFYFFVN